MNIGKRDRAGRGEQNRDLIAKHLGIGSFMAEVDQRLRDLQPLAEPLDNPSAQTLLTATRLELESAQRKLDLIGPLLPVASRVNAMVARYPRAAGLARRTLRYIWLRWRQVRPSA